MLLRSSLNKILINPEIDRITRSWSQLPKSKTNRVEPISIVIRRDICCFIIQILWAHGIAVLSQNIFNQWRLTFQSIQTIIQSIDPQLLLKHSFSGTSFFFQLDQTHLLLRPVCIYLRISSWIDLPIFGSVALLWTTKTEFVCIYI